MDIHPDRHTSRHQDTQISGQTDIHLDIKTHTDIQMDGPTYRQTDDRHIDGPTDIQPSRQMDRHPSRKIYIKTS